MFDYMTLRIIWWALLGILLMGFAIMDGFDLGAAMLHPFVAKNDVQRRVVINTIGPVWEGNQVWFILAGGATFAAWPYVYSASFSGFYLAMLLILVGLILRPVAITFRSKIDAPKWRQTWDWAFFFSGLLPSLLCGVAFGNLLRGTPFYFDHNMRSFYEGNLFGLLHPFALLCGLVSVSMLVMQGSAWLSVKTEGDVAERCRVIGVKGALATVFLFVICGLWVWLGIYGYHITDGADPYGLSNPMLKSVSLELGYWLTNYRNHPILIIVPVIVFVSAALTVFSMKALHNKTALFFSSITVASVILTAGVSLFPFLMPSSSHPEQSLTVWDSSSSQMTLGLMLMAAVFFLPIVLTYTAWVYRVLRGPVTETAISNQHDFYY